MLPNAVLPEICHAKQFQIPEPCTSTSTSQLCSHTPHITLYLPLRLLTIQERLQDCNNLLQRRQPHLQFRVDLLGVFSELDVEVLAVGAGRHGGAEDRLDHEGVMRLKGIPIGVAEGSGEFIGGNGEVLGQGYGCEVESSV